MSIHIIENQKLIIDDAISGMRSLPDQSVQAVLTSPPYFGLRKYFDDGRPELGAEDHPYEYIENLCEILEEIKRPLRDDGTFWLNIGDSWAGSGRGPTGKTANVKHAERQGFDSPKVIIPEGWKAKDMFGVPHLVAQRLRSSGWYLRQEIIWMKPNCVPFSGDDRCTNQIEYLFMFSKKKRYFYDNFGVRQQGHDVVYHPAIEQGVRTINMRNVWVIPPDNRSSHTATFPKELVKRVIHLATPQFACETCQAPITRSIVRHSTKRNPREAERRISATNGAISGGTRNSTLGVTKFTTYDLNGYKKCGRCAPGVSDYYSEPGPYSQAVILDPFVGSGTTLEVAYETGRAGIGIDLDHDSIEHTERRIYL